MLKAHPTSFPSREADAVTTAFIADIHSRLPALCGTTLRYSSKAFTPTVGLQPLTAIGLQATGRAVNLKAGPQLPKPTPKDNLRYYPASPPSKFSSQPALAGVPANLPTHSASLGAQPSKPPPKKRLKVNNTQALDSICLKNVTATLAGPDSATTPTTGASICLTAAQSDITTNIQPRQSTTTCTPIASVVNVPSQMEAALNSGKKETSPVSETTRQKVGAVGWVNCALTATVASGICSRDYSGTSLLWIPLGRHEVSRLKRCPYFRGCFVM